MIEIELDGKKISVPEGSMVMHAADAAGAYIPHFCYHKKLSIAANCRMCLVEVEKAPKPMPACATPVTNGMVVRTKSDRAIKAQQSVMEFLLINHPLDCPICDQGGECQLQDLAVGYGKSASRYDEEKRVVLSKDVGPLISMEEMTRCIHCTRCVRFGQEIAGVMELGMVNRGEHSEIATIAGETVDSELSGNMIDICPVGALTSKPFRYSARTWELSRRKSVSPHDSTGSNLIVQVKAGEVKRVVPLENEAVNECWIADRDRFSYEALHAPSRLTAPMIKQVGVNGPVWQTVDWTTALNYVADGLKRVIAEFGASEFGAVAAPHATLEELHLLAKLVRGLGSDNVDHRLRHAADESSPPPPGVRWLGRSIASLSTLDRAFVIGSFLRKDHPLFAQRLRQAARRGAQVHSLGAGQDDWLMPMGHRLVAAPSGWVERLTAVVQAAAAVKGGAGAGEGDAAAIAASLLDGKDKAILLGQSVAQHPDAARIVDLAHSLAAQTGATFGWLGDGANDVGAQWVGALPRKGGLSAARMLSQPMKALLLLDVEPLLDGPNPAAARAALDASGLVVALTPFSDVAADYADVMLPIAPFAETSGSLVNAEGRLQSFHGVTKPRGETRPAWKVLRVLGNLLGLAGFDHETSEAARDEAVKAAGAIEQRLDNTPGAKAASPTLAATIGQGTALERIADVPIYQTDSLVRRAPALQATADARSPAAALPTAVWQSLGLRSGDRVTVTQGSGSATLVASHDPTLAPTAVRVSAARNETADLGPMFGPVSVRKA